MAHGAEGRREEDRKRRGKEKKLVGYSIMEHQGRTDRGFGWHLAEHKMEDV
jgi:hypothetical protein